MFSTHTQLQEYKTQLQEAKALILMILVRSTSY